MEGSENSGRWFQGPRVLFAALAALAVLAAAGVLLRWRPWSGPQVYEGLEGQTPEAAAAVPQAQGILQKIVPRDVERRQPDCETFPSGVDGPVLEQEVCGATTRFRFAWPTGKEAAAELRSGLEAEGDEVLYVSDEQVVARRWETDAFLLWKKYTLAGQDSSAVLVRQALLRPGREFSFELDRSQAPEYVFYTEHPGDRLMRLEVEVSDADFSLKGSYRQAFGELERYVSAGGDFYRVHGPRFEIGGVPQYTGQTEWKIAWLDGLERVTVRARWESGPPLEPIEPGDALGGIRLRNVDYGRATVRPEFEDSITFPGYDEAAWEGDRTPLGEAVFWLPPGYWTVQVVPESREGDLESLTGLECHLVPVQPGRITIVDWPPSLARAFGRGEAGRVEILDVQAGETEAGVDVALVGNVRLDVVPSLETVQVFESGAEAKVLGVERLETPLDVVLLMDSSGSMRGQMAAATAAAVHFVEGLPASARVTAVDFDTRPRELKAGNRRELVAALRRLRTDGATALYDSIILGLERLQGKNRPALIVFTDGVDANLDDTGPGSEATKEEVLEAVRSAGVPVFSIGLGEKSDRDTLQRLADLSGGAYYAVESPEDLDPVFEQIQKNLGSWYRIRFSRPPRPRLGAVPVVSLVVDNSGSMDLDPSQPGCDYRIEKVRQTLRRFVDALPEEFLVQLLTFSDDVGVPQVLSRDRAPLDTALWLMRGEGGTNTLAALRAALDSLRAVPSTQRYLVFLTDAALEVDEEQVPEFETLLASLRDAQVRSLWLGMVGEEAEAVFARAAELSGGRYVLATDLERVAEVFEELGREIRDASAAPARSFLRVEIRYHDASGLNATLVAARDVDFPPAREADVPVNPEFVRWTPGPPLRPYDPDLARDISGADRVGYEVLVTKRIPLEYEAKNEAVRIRLGEAVFLSRLRGIDAPQGYRYLAVTMTLENILPAQRVAILPDGSHHPAAWVGGDAKPVRYEHRVPTYLIPDLKRHLFLRWNNARSFPASEVTWLLENPLLAPGENGVAVPAGEPVTGAVAFLVPAGRMEAASLRLYDTAYGHAFLPLCGVTREDEPIPLEELPEEAPTRLSETLSFRVLGYRDLTEIEGVEAGEGAVFRVFEGELISRIQAHLQMDPAERIRLRVQEESGSRFFRVHPISERLPFGYFRPTLFTAGSRNRVELAFRIPAVFGEEKRPMALVFDLAGGGISVPAVGRVGPDRLPGRPVAGNDDVEIYLHRVARAEYVPEFGEGVVAVDATFRVPPGRGHLRLGELVVLKSDGFDAEAAARGLENAEAVRKLPTPSSHRSLASFSQMYLPPELTRLPGTLWPEAAESILPLALDSDSVLPAGQARRGWLLFTLPEDADPSDWRVGSLVFPEMSIPLSEEVIDEPLLRFQRLELPDDGDAGFWSRVVEKVEELSAQRRARAWRKPGAVPLRVVEPDRSVEVAPHLAPPGLTLAGARVLSELADLNALRRAVERLRLLPGGEVWEVRYAPEAVLTQGWGTAADIAVLAERVLSREGQRTRRVAVELTDASRVELARRCGVREVSATHLPGLAFREPSGREVVLVAPFLEDVRELPQYVKPGITFLDEAPTPGVELTVGILSEPEGGDRREQMRRMTDVLAGEEGAGWEETLLLDVSLALPDLSLDCLDLGFTQVPARGTVVYKAVLDTPAGRYVTDDDSAPEVLGRQVHGWFLELRTPEASYRRTFFLPDDTQLTGVFATLAINSGDLPPSALASIQEERRRLRRETPVPPDSLSALRWYTHGVVARFLGAQSRWEADAARALGLVSGRSRRTRCLAVTVSKGSGDGALRAQFDLIDPFPDLHGASDPRAEKAFRIVEGLVAAELERAALGSPGVGLRDVWAAAPRDMRLLFIGPDNRDELLEAMRERKYPEPVIRYIGESEKFLLFPTAPGIVNGRVRWAWLEVDPETFDIRAVLDDGTGGALVESLIGNLYEQATSYLVGAFVGISVSLWSVSAFSLELEDYREILDQAEKFARALGENFKVGNQYAGLSPGDLPSGSVDLDRAVTFKLDFTGFSASNNLLGFGNGYQDGITYYFQHAR